MVGQGLAPAVVAAIGTVAPDRPLVPKNDNSNTQQLEYAAIDFHSIES